MRCVLRMSGGDGATRTENSTHESLRNEIAILDVPVNSVWSRRTIIDLVMSFRLYGSVLLGFIITLAILVSQLPSSHIFFDFATHPSQWSHAGMEDVRDRALNHTHEGVLFYFTFGVAYVFFQTFSVPGSFILNTFAGASMPFLLGFLLCCVFNTAGACTCYCLAKYSWGPFIEVHFKERIAQFNEELSHHRQNLLVYCTLLRLFPLCPCWFVNLTSAFVNIPLSVFAISVFLGLMPYNYLTVSAGAVLSDLGSPEPINIHMTLLKLSAIAAICSLPLLFRHQIMARMQTHPIAEMPHVHYTELANQTALPGDEETVGEGGI